ncbi:hypothetical protein R6Q57_014730 [Mikania cordata]
MESYNPHRRIGHLHGLIDVVFQLKGQEQTTETLDYPDTYFVKWFMHVCCQGRQDRVGPTCKVRDHIGSADDVGSPEGRRFMASHGFGWNLRFAAPRMVRQRKTSSSIKGFG